MPIQPSWDFNEKINYVKVNGYLVINKPDKYQTSELLKKIHTTTIKALVSISQNEKKSDEINLLLSTPFELREIQLIKDQGSIKFIGLNKPKEVHLTTEPPIGPDKNLRAKYRVIFLQLRDSNGKLKNVESLKNLISHELAHTALNHVTWKDDNHPPEFYEMQRTIRKYM